MYLLGILTCVVLKLVGDEAEKQAERKDRLMRKAREGLKWEEKD